MVFLIVKASLIHRSCIYKIKIENVDCLFRHQVIVYEQRNMYIITVYVKSFECEKF